MKEIKIKVVDFGNDKFEDNFLINVLGKNFHIVESETPDFLLYSVCGNKHLEYNCVKIFYTAEPITPNFNECDYAIGFDFIDFENRYFRLPFFAMHTTKEIQNRNIELNDWNKRKFCNFIYSNETVGNGAVLRKEFCKRLMKEKHVDCPGMVLHNMSDEELGSRYAGDWYRGKTRFLSQYKFTIAFENTLMNGYTTEKLIQPLMAGSIPIYYGNPRVGEEFNTKAFINCNDYNNDWERIIERILEIDNNDELAINMLKQSPMREDFNFDWQEQLTTFLLDIVAKGNRPICMYQYGKQLKNDVKTKRNTQAYGHGLIDEIKQFSNIVIFGDGIYGNRIGEIITTNNVGSLKCFVVSKNIDMDKTLQGVPVVSVNELEVNQNTLILIAVREEAVEQVILQLSELGHNNFMSIGNFEIDAIREAL